MRDIELMAIGLIALLGCLGVGLSAAGVDALQIASLAFLPLWLSVAVGHYAPVSYTHLTLPTKA